MKMKKLLMVFLTLLLFLVPSAQAADIVVAWDSITDTGVEAVVLYWSEANVVDSEVFKAKITDRAISTYIVQEKYLKNSLLKQKKYLESSSTK